MIKKLYFWQYRHKDTAVHSLDPRIKILVVISLSILAFISKGIHDVIIFSLFILLCIILSKMDIKTIATGLRPFYFIFIFIFLMYFLFAPSKLLQSFITIWRFLMFILISLVLTFTTPISGMVAAIEKLSMPLKIFGIKPRNIATMISIAIRFMPVMFLSFERAKDAMASRLADFRKMKHIKLIVTLMLHKMLKSASNLSDAMYARMYDENVESKRLLKLGSYDYASIALIIILFAVIY